MPIRHVIWDWNGTLLDDVDASVTILAGLLAERGLPPVSRDEYRRRFGFPVQAFYEGVGFDFSQEPFAELSRVFIARYRAAALQLFPTAPRTLAAVEARGIGQLVVSAMQTDLLGAMLTEHGIARHFSHVRGRDDLSAESKVDLGLATVRELDLPVRETLLVGDTLHDHEVGRAIGCRVVLFAHGHQEHDRLAATGAPVVTALPQILEHLT